MTPTNRTLALAFAGALAIVGSAHAQQSSSLVGAWQGTLKDADNVKMPFRFTYYPDGTFSQTVAIPPNKSGSGSGTIVSSGTYRMLSDHSLQLNEQQRKMCASGVPGCTAVPPGGNQTISFRFNGSDTVVNTGDGTVTYRVR